MCRLKMLLLFLAVFIIFSSNIILAQPAADPPLLSGSDKRDLTIIARDALDAQLEDRSPRQPTVGPRLQIPQGMVVSLYLNGRLLGRNWRILKPLPLADGARDIAILAANEPKGGGLELSSQEIVDVDIAIAVLYGYTQITSDSEVPPQSAVVVYNGFHEGLALPADIPGGSAADLLAKACESAGLRPNAWLLPQTSVFAAKIDQTSPED